MNGWKRVAVAALAMAAIADRSVPRRRRTR